MTSSTYEGVLAYPVTPMTRDGSEVELTTYRRLLDRLLDAGVSAVIPLGSAGEFPYLTATERKEVAAATVEHVNGRVPVVVGVSAIATADAIGFATHAEQTGADGIMISFPTYYGLSAAEVRGHVERIAGDTSLPIILYNNPFTSAIDLDVPLLGELAHIDSVAAVKEATMDVNRVTDISRAFGDRFAVLGGGYDPYAFSVMSLGVRGWTTAMANLVPEQCVELFDTLVRRQDLTAAREQNERLLPLANLLVELGLSKAVKAGLGILGMDAGPARAPLTRLGEQNLARLREALAVARAFDTAPA